MHSAKSSLVRRQPSPLRSWRLAILANSTSASMLAYAGIKVLLGWVVLERTSSAFLVALAFALLMLPRLLFGLHLGVLVDHVDRRAAAVIAGLLAAAVSVALALFLGEGGVGILLLGSFVIGLVEGLRVIAIQTLVYDAVRATHATAALALSNFIGNLGQGLGALLIGALLELFGSRTSLFVVAAAYVFGSMILLIGKRSNVPVHVGDGSGGWHREIVPGSTALGIAEVQERDADSTLRGNSASAARTGVIKSAISDPAVRQLALTSVILEVLGFSSAALLPVLADDVYGVGASGLGAMYGIRSAGGALGLLALAWTVNRSDSLHKGHLLLAFAVVFGSSVALLGLAQGFALAMAILFVVGVAASCSETLLQTLLLSTSRHRGSAMGVWVWTLGFGPIGQIQVGIIATVLGAQATLGINGVIMVAACSSLALLPVMKRSSRNGAR